jgi:hypothetical protein
LFLFFILWSIFDVVSLMQYCCLLVPWNAMYLYTEIIISTTYKLISFYFKTTWDESLNFLWKLDLKPCIDEILKQWKNNEELTPESFLIHRYFKHMYPLQQRKAIDPRSKSKHYIFFLFDSFFIKQRKISNAGVMYLKQIYWRH